MSEVKERKRKDWNNKVTSSVSFEKVDGRRNNCTQVTGGGRRQIYSVQTRGGEA